MIETYLYIKQHEITGLKYFGKTTRNPYKYNGSGEYWLRHIKTHGKEYVKTVWCKLFTDIDELQRVALALSDMYDIVDSPFWANMKPENGLDGGLTKEYLPEKTRQKMSAAQKGKILSEETRKKCSEANKGQIPWNKGKTGVLIHSKETKQKMSISHKGKNTWMIGKTLSEETKQKMSDIKKGKLQPITICPHCNKSGGSSNMKRWHFDNCKLKGKEL